MKCSKRITLVLLATLITFFFFLGGGQWLSFSSLKSGLAALQHWQASRPMMAMTGFFLLYIGVTALSLPGAAAMTLAAGALFGLAWGSLLVSFASSIGAWLAFLLARYLFRDVIEARFSTRLAAVNAGIAGEGALYLFTLRLVPAIPFFLINILSGLTRMRAWTFYYVSQLGMLAGTLVYVNAGTQLARIRQPSDILSMPLLVSFALLGAFPWIARAGMQRYKRRGLYRRWRRPAHYDRNLIVIGAGAAGLVSAYIAAAVKARVTLIESHKMGGDCLNYGCVPSKALIRSAKAAHQFRQADRWGLSPITPTISFRRVMARVHEAMNAIAPHDSIERYTQLGVDVRQGHARLVDPWTVELTDPEGKKERLTTRSIVLATGARPFIPTLPGLEPSDYVTSDTLWTQLKDLDHAPARLVVLGGGPIGCELAQAFARLGSQVTQIELAPRLMIREDDEVSTFIRHLMANEGVNIRLDHRALRVERDENDKYLVIAGQSGEQRIAFDKLLIAVGRQARIEGYGLEDLGIPAPRTIQTNEFLETLYPNIYAAGDVAGPYQFTHTAAHQAWYAAVNALFGHFKRFRVDYSVIPWVTFTDPEIARVGLNEREAGEKGISFEVTRYGIADLDRAITEADTAGWIKVLTEPGRDRILGVTIVSAHAGEMLSEFVLAMKQGLGLNRILATIHPYPTWTEANKYAAGEWKRAHAPARLLALLEIYHRWMRRSVL